MPPFLHASHSVYQNKKWLFDQFSSFSLPIFGISVKKHSVGGRGTCPLPDQFHHQKKKIHYLTDTFIGIAPGI